MEYKLIPVNDLSVATTQVCQGQNIKETHQQDLIKDGGNVVNANRKTIEIKSDAQDDVKHYITNLLEDKTLSNSFKIKILNILSRKNNDTIPPDMGALESPDFFDMIKNYVVTNKSHVADANRIYNYLKGKKYFKWNANGDIKLHGEDIKLGMPMLFKILMTKNMAVKKSDLATIKNIFSDGEDMRPYIKNIIINHSIDRDLLSDDEYNSVPSDIDEENIKYEIDINPLQKKKQLLKIKIW